MIDSIDHVGIVVNNIEEGLRLYRDILGLKLVSMEIIEKQMVKIAKLEIGESKIELLEPISQNSSIYKFLLKNGPGIHHIAFKVSNIMYTISDLIKGKVRLTTGDIEDGSGGAKIAFCNPKTTIGTLIEITTGEG